MSSTRIIYENLEDAFLKGFAGKRKEKAEGKEVRRVGWERKVEARVRSSVKEGQKVKLKKKNEERGSRCIPRSKCAN